MNRPSIKSKVMMEDQIQLTKNKLSMVIHPLQGDEANLTVASFTTSVDALRKVAGKFHCKDLRIVKLSSNSPVTLTVADAIPEVPSLEMFITGLDDFKNTGEIPIAWGRAVIDSVLDLLAPVGKSVARFSISTDKKSLEIDAKYKVAFENKIQRDFSAVGSVDGMLEAVNIHGKKNTVALYPVIGNSKIALTFDDQLLEKIKQFIGFYVEITGELVYRWRDKHPYAGTISGIEHINEDGLPTFSDLFGLAPNATKGVPAEDFITSIRSEW